MQTHPTDLGPFASDEGKFNTIAGVAIVAALLAMALAIVRPVVASISTADPTSAGRVAIPLGLFAVLLSLIGGYQAVARGEQGRGAARYALYAGSAAALLGFGYTAVVDGAVRLDRFADAYFDREIITAIWSSLLRGVVVTMSQALLAEALAITVGLIVASGELSSRRWLRYPAVAYVDVVRGLPLLMLAFLVYFGLTFVGITLSPFIAIIVILTINASAYCAEIFRAGIQAIPRGQQEAARSLGMPHAMTLIFVLIPQAVRAVIPPLMSEFIALVKDTAVANLVVGTTAVSADLFSRARTSAASTFSPTPYALASMFYLLITIPMARAVGKVERRLRSGLA